MKLRVLIKDPDAIYEAVAYAVDKQVLAMEDISYDERRMFRESRTAAVNETLATWIKYGEYIGIEFDTEEGTATVLPVDAIK